MSQGRKRGAALVGVGALGLLAWLFRGLIPGLSGDPADAPDMPPAGPEQIFTVVASGDTCEVEGDTQPCAQVCARLDASANVQIDGTHGAHAAVAALEKCLKDKGAQVAVKNR